MKSLFTDKITDYYKLLEQDIGTPDQTAPTPDQNQQSAQLQQTPPPVKSSVGYAVLAQLVVDAFKTLDIQNKDDIKFSDNIVRSANDAYQYLKIIKRNIAPDLQTKLQQNVGKSENKNDLDSADLIKLTQLALSALFFRPKDADSAEFNNITDIEKVTVDNAKEIIQKIQMYISQRKS